jgi:hypothetical protein
MCGLRGILRVQGVIAGIRPVSKEQFTATIHGAFAPTTGATVRTESDKLKTA